MPPKTTKQEKAFCFFFLHYFVLTISRRKSWTFWHRTRSPPSRFLPQLLNRVWRFDVGQKILLRRVISRLQLNSENRTASKPVASEVSLLPGLDLQQELCSIEHSPTLRRPRTLMCPKPCSFTFWHLRFELFLHVMLKDTFTSLPSCPERLLGGYCSCSI